MSAFDFDVIGDTPPAPRQPPPEAAPARSSAVPAAQELTKAETGASKAALDPGGYFPTPEFG